MLCAINARFGVKQDGNGERMKSFAECIDEYRKQIKKGDIQKAYRGIMEYVMHLKSYFATRYPDCVVSGSIYYGYMDMTYFSIFPEQLKRKKLKIAVVFLHDPLHFEVWLAGSNKQVQTKYWKLLKESNWNKYHIPASIKGEDSIMEQVLADDPDFSDLDALTKQIEKGTSKFIQDVVTFLSKK